MAKYPHHPDTLIVLKDLENRLQQLIEAGDLAEEQHPELVKYQRTAFQSCLVLVRQCISTGHVFRGSSYVPDGLLPYVKTPSPQETLIKDTR